jgi:hypothetical protein
LYFAAGITLLVEQTNWFCQQYLDFLDDWLSPVLDVTDSEMFLFLAVIFQLGRVMCS